MVARYERFDQHSAWNEAMAMANDREYVTNALANGVRAITASYIAEALQLLRAGRHNEADAVARRAEAALAVEYAAAQEDAAARRAA